MLCPSLHGLHEMVNICADFGTDYHVTFNDKKTTCIMFGTSAAGCKCISVNDNCFRHTVVVITDQYYGNRMAEALAVSVYRGTKVYDAS